MKKILSIFLLTMMVLSSMTPVLAGDSVDFRVKEDIVYGGTPEDHMGYVTEDDEEVEYNMFCVEEDAKYITPHRITNDEIVVQKGVIDYVVNNWNDSFTREEIHQFQLGIWNITNSFPREAGSSNLEMHPGVLIVNKTLGSPSSIVTVTNTTLENGTIVTKTVTTWTSNLLQFVFRMAGNGIHEDDNQDILLFRTLSLEDTWTEVEELFTPPEPPKNPIDPETPNGETPAEPELPDIITPQDDGPGGNTSTPDNNITGNTPQSPGDSAVNGEVSADNTVTASAGTAMKNTGIPLVAILLVLIASAAGIIVRKK